MDWRSRITVEPGKRGGKPCIRGLRITVTDVLEYLASGMSEDDLLRDSPDLTREDIRACLAFAADRERKFVPVPPGCGRCRSGSGHCPRAGRDGCRRRPASGPAPASWSEAAAG